MVSAVPSLLLHEFKYLVIDSDIEERKRLGESLVRGRPNVRYLALPAHPRVADLLKQKRFRNISSVYFDDRAMQIHAYIEYRRNVQASFTRGPSRRKFPEHLLKEKRLPIPSPAFRKGSISQMMENQRREEMKLYEKLTAR